MLGPFSKYGRQARPLPLGVGKVFYVVPASSAIMNDMEKAYPVDEDGVKRVWQGNSGLADAMALCTAGQRDEIRMLPGAYTISTVVAANVADVAIIGLGTPGAVKLTGSAASLITVTADNVEIAGLEMNIATTKKAITLTGADNCYIHDNVFKSAVGGSASHFIHMLTTACNDNLISNNRFISMLDVSGGGITQTSHITGLGIGNIIEHNMFVAGRVTTDNAGAVTDGILFVDAADAGNLIRHNSFTEFNGATFTNAVDYGTTALKGSVLCVENNFHLVTSANAVVNGSNEGSLANNIASGVV